ncbi:MAG: hypothetical protein M1376_02970 [Planctomycetes bacterium]|nr:hypothetical protein [Planctomycetota bacterium]
MFRNRTTTWPSHAAWWAALVLLTLGVGGVQADFTFGPREKVDFAMAFPTLDPAYDGITSFSSDGLEIYVQSTRPGGLSSWMDLWVTRRGSTDADWAPLENLGPAVNVPNGAALSTITGNGLELYFNSDRPGGQGDFDLYVATRKTRNNPWSQAVNLGPKVNGPACDGVPSITRDGLELYFTSNRPGGHGNFDVYVARRATVNDPWGEAENLGPLVNSEYDDAGPSISPDGRVLLYQDYLSTPRPNGYGGGDFWMTRRAGRSAPWGSPVNLGPAINGPNFEHNVHFSPDGCVLHYSTASADWSVVENWQAPILPIVDFNSDQKVDLVDLVMLIDNWGTSNTQCDIGPMPWGDGKVDIEDLKVFMTYWEKDNPPQPADSK